MKVQCDVLACSVYVTYCLHCQDLVINIDDRYRLLRKLGEGGFGAVYEGVSSTATRHYHRLLTIEGIDIRTNEQVAIKLEHSRHGYGKLKGEAQAYTALAGQRGIPRVL